MKGLKDNERLPLLGFVDNEEREKGKRVAHIKKLCNGLRGKGNISDWPTNRLSFLPICCAFDGVASEKDEDENRNGICKRN